MVENKYYDLTFFYHSLFFQIFLQYGNRFGTFLLAHGGGKIFCLSLLGLKEKLI